MDKVRKANVAAQTARRTSRRPGCAAEGRAPVVSPPRRALTAWEVRLRPTPTQERKLDLYLNRLTGFWNWAISRYQWHLDNRTFSEYALDYELKGHAEKCGLPRAVMIGMARRAFHAWTKVLAKHGKRPRRKGVRNKLTSFDVPVDFAVYADRRRIRIPGVKQVKFAGPLPDDLVKVRSLTITKRASGWYCTCVCEIKEEPRYEPGTERIGIDPGYSTWLTLSTGEKIEIDRAAHERDLRRLRQTQRGGDRRLAAKLHERMTRRIAHRQKKVVNRICRRASLVALSADNVRGLQKMFGKSVRLASHAGLRNRLERKCRLGGVQFVAVPSRHSTRTCSACGSLSGPAGYAGLKVRQWVCSECGAEHDRDTNAARNILLLGEKVLASRVPRGTSGNALVGQCARAKARAGAVT